MSKFCKGSLDDLLGEEDEEYGDGGKAIHHTGKGGNNPVHLAPARPSKPEERCWHEDTYGDVRMCQCQDD